MKKISLVSCKEYEAAALAEALEKTFQNLGGIERFVRQGTKVALKPNLLAPIKPEEACATHPALVKALVLLIQKAGGTATIIDSPGGPYLASYLKQVYAVTGMEKAAQETGAALNYDLSLAEVSNPDAKYLKKLTVLKPLIDADLVINLPKLKTHGQMVYTGAIKNLFGAIPGTEKIRYHMTMPDYGQFADTLIDIFLSVKPGLTIMDAVVGMNGAGPRAGDPKHIGLILAGEDAFALDRAALHVVGVEPKEVPVLKAAIERGLCPQSVNDIEFSGENIEKVRIKDFNVPLHKDMGAVSYGDKGILKFFGDRIKPRPVFLHKNCNGCGECARSCPVKVISLRGGRPEADLSACIRCFCCQELCPRKAVAIKRLPGAVSGFGYLMLFGLSMIVNAVKGERKDN